MYIKLDPTNLNTPNTAGDNAATLVTSRSSSASSDDGTPPTYGYNIAVVTVANGFTTITNGNIADKRAQVILTTGSSNPAGGWTATSAPTTITALGNRSYTMLFPSVDITGTVSNGMRLKMTRTVTAPTQSTSLNGSTQYYSKTSPAGMTFTDDFTVSAWVKLSAYPSARASIASRYNGTSGWVFDILSTGQVNLVAYNAASANYSQVLSYQSIPLNKWVHVTAQLDMSTFTATTTTSYTMLDGVDVPASVSRAGTNPTTLVQAGNLEIGSENGGLNPLNGKIAQVAIYSAKVTQATILASMNQTLSGTETSLVSAYSFNNTINDLNTNANNLTANGSAVATNLDTPFTQTVTGVTTGTTNYGIITNIAYSTNTTVTVQVPEGGTLPTSGGINAVSYSSQKVPFGFPASEDKWTIQYFFDAANAHVANGGAWGILPGVIVSIPLGKWRQDSNMLISGTSSAASTAFVLKSQWDSSSPAINKSSQAYGRQDGGTGGFLVRIHRHPDYLDLSAATTYSLYTLLTSGSGTQEGYLEAGFRQTFQVTCAYL